MIANIAIFIKDSFIAVIYINLNKIIEYLAI